MKLNKNIIEYLFKGSNQKLLSRDELLNMEIPIPDIKIQKEIVETLDILSSNIETCKKQIEESKYILNKYIQLNSKGFKNKISDICETKLGKFNSKDKKETGKYPFFTSDANSPCGFSDEFCFDFKEYLILIKDGGAGQGKYGDQIGLGKVFNIKGKSCATSHQYAIILKDNCDKILNDYLYLFLMTKKNQIMDLALYTTGLGCIRKDDFGDLIIEYPSLEKQKEIVEYCKDIYDLIEKNKIRIEKNKLLMKNIIENYLQNNLKDTKKEKICESKNEDDIESKSDSDENNKQIKIKKLKKSKTNENEQIKETYEWSQDLLKKIKKYQNNKEKLTRIMIKNEIPKDIFNDKVKELQKEEEISNESEELYENE
jgi:restriction endonuclease S subunit